MSDGAAPSFEEYGGRIQQHVETFQQQFLPDWESAKSPYFKSTEAPVALMTYQDVAVEARPWSNIRRSAMAAPIGYSWEEAEDMPPVTNWANHYFDPAQWEQVKEHHDGDRYAVHLTLPARENLKTQFKEYLVDDDETVLVNPIDCIDLFSDKYSTAAYLDDHDLPSVPSLSGEEALSMSDEEIAATLGDGADGYVVKPVDRFGGEGVGTFDALDAVREYLADDLGIGNGGTGEERTVVQPKIPHHRDTRVVVVGENIVNAEQRIAPDNEFRTNISMVGGVMEYRGFTEPYDLGIYGTAYNAAQQGRVVPLNVDVYEQVSDTVKDRNPTVLSTDDERLAGDVLDTLDADTFNYDRSLPEPPILLGMDVLTVRPDDLEHLPYEHRERAQQYGDDGGRLVMEFNGNPGSMVDVLARWNDRPEQISFVHFTNLLHTLAGNDEAVEPVIGAPENDVIENAETLLWRRTDAYYPELDGNLAEHVYTLGTE